MHYQWHFSAPLAAKRVYQLQGKDIMMISIIAPVYDANGDFLGVAGCDLALDDMQTHRNSFSACGVIDCLIVHYRNSCK